MIEHARSLQGIVSSQVIATFKEYNAKCYYNSNHKEKYDMYKGAARDILVVDFKYKLKSQ